MLPNSLPPHVHESKLVLRHFPVSSVHFFLSTAEVSVKLHEVFPHCAILTQQLLTKCHFSVTSDEAEFFGGERNVSSDPYIHAYLLWISNDAVWCLIQRILYFIFYHILCNLYSSVFSKYTDSTVPCSSSSKWPYLGPLQHCWVFTFSNFSFSCLHNWKCSSETLKLLAALQLFVFSPWLISWYHDSVWSSLDFFLAVQWMNYNCYRYCVFLFWLHSLQFGNLHLGLAQHCPVWLFVRSTMIPHI